MACSYDFPNEPPDDRKSFEDMLRHPRIEQNYDISNWKLIGTFVYYPDKEETKFERNPSL